MAESPAHAWGQIIGHIIERGIYPILQTIAEEFSLYLDRVGPRDVRPGKKLTWVDRHGNRHDLDFVFERHGSEDVRGEPVGFIEVAWRRYTKHSKNKAQEIQGAILPLAETYEEAAPFIGAVIAGEFTQPALDQLRSLGFEILYFDYDSVVTAFEAAGIDARTEEGTSAYELEGKIAAWRSLTVFEQDSVVSSLLKTRAQDVSAFADALRRTFGRIVERITITPLFGSVVEFVTLAAALEFMGSGIESGRSDTFARVEIEVFYTSGDVVRGRFGNSLAAEEFLRRIVPFVAS